MYELLCIYHTFFKNKILSVPFSSFYQLTLFVWLENISQAGRAVSSTLVQPRSLNGEPLPLQLMKINERHKRQLNLRLFLHMIIISSSNAMPSPNMIHVFVRMHSWWLSLIMVQREVSKFSDALMYNMGGFFFFFFFTMKNAYCSGF